MISRRRFLCASGALLLVPRLLHAEAGKSAVVEIKTSRLSEGDGPNEDAIRKAISLGVRKVANEERAPDAWRRLFTPTDVIGIKFNHVAAGELRGNAEIARAIVAELFEAGIPDRQVVVIEGEQVRGTTRANPEGDLATFRACDRPVRFKKYMTQQVTALINIPLLKHHCIAGVTLGLKNMSHGTIWNPSDFHHNHCDPAIAEINALAPLRDKLRLTICNALYGLADGGPYVKDTRFVWRESALLLSTDVVALDSVGLGMIRARRRAMGLPTLEEAGVPPAHIKTAAKQGLGRIAADRVQLDLG